MQPEIRLTFVTSAADEVQQHTFTEPTTCTVGRADDCTVVVAPSVLSTDVSRRHCEVRIGFNPPRAVVRDLESLNGTFVNKVKIGQRHLRSDDPMVRQEQLVLLQDGDELRLGQATAYRVEIHDRASAFDDSPESSLGQDSAGGFATALMNLVKGWGRKDEA